MECRSYTPSTSSNARCEAFAYRAFTTITWDIGMLLLQRYHGHLARTPGSLQKAEVLPSIISTIDGGFP